MNSNLASVINQLLKDRKITQKAIAKEINISETALSQIMKGKYNFSEKKLDKISKIVNIPVPVLYFLTLYESHVPEEKQELFKVLYPAATELLNMVFDLRIKNK